MFDCQGFGASFFSSFFTSFLAPGASRLSIDVHGFTELSCEKGNSLSSSSMLCVKLKSRFTDAKRLERRFFRIFHFSIATAAQKTNHWKMFYAKFESNHRRKMIICFFFKSTISSKNITMVKKKKKSSRLK